MNVTGDINSKSGQIITSDNKIKLKHSRCKLLDIIKDEYYIRCFGLTVRRSRDLLRRLDTDSLQTLQQISVRVLISQCSFDDIITW